jgi:hypothetical protein
MVPSSELLAIHDDPHTSNYSFESVTVFHITAVENPFDSSFNGMLCDERSNVEAFETLLEA